MNQNKGLSSAVLGRLLFIGFSFQIVLGIIWMIGNFGYLQLFGDTAFYVKVSGNLVTDEYTGVLYPALLLFIRAICTVLPLKWFSVMYFLQLVFAGFSGYFFLDTIEFGKHLRGAAGSSEKRGLFIQIWGSLVLLTFPFCMQCHMAIMPNSLSISLLFLEFSFAIKAWNSKHMQDGKAFSFEIGRVALFWLLGSITERYHFYVGLVTIVIILVRSAVVFYKSSRKGIIYPILIAILFCAMSIGLFLLPQEKGAYGAPSRSIEACLFERTVWKSKLMRLPACPQELFDVARQDTLVETSNFQGNVRRLLMPEIEEKLGKESAKDLYLTIAKKVMVENTGELVHDLGIDLAAHMIPPVLVKMFLDGSNYVSYTQRNVDIMSRNMPNMTMFYLKYSLLWFGVATIIIAVHLLMVALNALYKRSRLNQTGEINKSANKRFAKEKYIFLAVAMVIISVFGTMQGSGVYDYKQAIFQTMVWLIIQMKVMTAFEAEESSLK